MSNDPYPNERPDPRGDDPYSSDPYSSDPYSSDPYVRGGASGQPQLPAYEPGRSAPLPPPPGQPMPPPYLYPAVQQTPTNTSAIVLIVLSSLSILTGYCCYIGIPGLVLGILGVTKQATDPEGAAKLTKIGWISFGALIGLTVLVVGGAILLAVLSEA
ncbi:hypothetical protein ASG73_15325 [Janibacter sp. Soil728]|uniref:hypothetical protein n=1 Tax=Janibacter sp. Soil728 TaxID=1736393 RepID=UPI0006F39744|nr:hypothetical protein [Janibacter sp. Soil728]KRE36028.1 hypothetical protein ASG73_15325 [Janibacter sp. Soil728]